MFGNCTSGISEEFPLFSVRIHLIKFYLEKMFVNLAPGLFFPGNQAPKTENKQKRQPAHLNNNTVSPGGLKAGASYLSGIFCSAPGLSKMEALLVKGICLDMST